MKYYPTFLNLENKNVLIIGNSYELKRRIEILLKVKANIKLVHPIIPKNINNFIKKDLISYRKGTFNENDLEEIWLVISVSNNKNLNNKISRLSQANYIFCSIYNDQSLSSFIFPAIISRGDITIAISTNGKSPALGQKIKNNIQKMIELEYEQYLDIMEKIRPIILTKIPDWKRRKEIFYQLVNDKNIFQLLKENKILDVEKYILRIIK